MRQRLRARGMNWLAHPVRVQRVNLHKKRKRMVERGRLSAHKPCWKCGYELRGLPGLVCTECNTAHDPAWYRGRFAAGRFRRQVAGRLVMSFYPWATLFGLLTLFIGALAWQGARVPAATMTFGTQEWIGMGLAAVGVVAWPIAWVLGLTHRHPVVWGPPRVALRRVIAVVLVCVVVVVGFVLMTWRMGPSP